MRKTQQTSVKVMVRMRPPATNYVQCEGDFSNQIRLEKRLYTFDHVFGPEATDDDLFAKVGNELIFNTMEGTNSCLFVYGQTGTGKTYTMTGNGIKEGLTQRTFRQLWHQLETISSVQNFSIKTSYIEIYNEEIKDLLADNATVGSLQLREHVKQGFFIEGMREMQMDGEAQIEEVIRRGAKNRTVKFTKMNQASSRSHTILTVVVECKIEQEGVILIRSAKLNFVDLAGCEKQKQTGVEGDSLKEASNINKSLSCLTRVISQLSEIKPSSRHSIHIPFRNSVLTMLLKDSLSGNSRTIIIGTISSNPNWMQETIGTLTFLEKAKKIKTETQVNEKTEGSEELMKKKIVSMEEKFAEMRAEMIRLQSQMQEAKAAQQKKDMEIEKLKALLLTCEQPLTIFDMFPQDSAQPTPNPDDAKSNPDFDDTLSRDSMLETIPEQNEHTILESDISATAKKVKKTRSECVMNNRYPKSQQLLSNSTIHNQQPNHKVCIQSLLKTQNSYLREQNKMYFEEEKKFEDLLALIKQNLQNLHFRDAEINIMMTQSLKLKALEEHLKNNIQHREKLIKEAELIQGKYRAQIRGARSMEIDNISVRSTFQSTENKLLRENAKLQEEKEKLQEDIGHMQERLREKDIEFKAKLYEIIEQIEAERNKCHQANQQIQRLNALILAQTVQSQNEKESVNFDLQNKMTYLENRNKQLEEDIDDLLSSGAISNLLNTVNEKQKEIDQITVQIKSKDQVIEQLRHQFQLETDKVTQLQWILQSKYQEIRQLKNKVSQLNKQLIRHEEETNLLEKEVTSKNQMLQTLQKDLLQLIQAHSSSKSKIKQQLSVKIEEISTLNQQNQEMKISNEWNNAKIGILKKTVAERNEKINQLEAANLKLISQLEHLKSDINSKNSLISTLQSQIQSLKICPKIEINEQTMSLPTLMTRYEQALEVINLSKQELTFLQNKCKHIQREFSQERERYVSKIQVGEEREKVLLNEIKIREREVEELRIQVFQLNKITKLMQVAQEGPKTAKKQGDKDRDKDKDKIVELTHKLSAQKQKCETYKALIAQTKESYKDSFMSQFTIMQQTQTELLRQIDEFAAEKLELIREKEGMILQMKKLNHDRRKYEQMIGDLKAQVRELKAVMQRGRQQPQDSILEQLKQKMEKMKGKKCEQDAFFMFKQMLLEVELKNLKIQNDKLKNQNSQLSTLLKTNKIKYC